MASTIEPLEEHEEPGKPAEGDAEERSTRRMLLALLIFLGVASVALLILLLWLLRPKPAAHPPGQAAGYPIEVVTTIYGYGDKPSQQIQKPLGVAFDPSGNVWVSDSGQSRVEVYTSGGAYIRTVGAQKGPGKLLAPYGLTIDPNTDRVYVADYGAHMLQVYTTTGGYVGHFPADDQNLKVFGVNGFSPYDVQVLNGRVVVSSNDGLYFFDDRGHVVARWGGLYKGKNVLGPRWGQFSFPDSFVVDPKTGRIYVADSLNRRIVAIDGQGRWLWASGRPDANMKIVGFWMLPRGIELGPDGNLYVVDTFRPDPKGMGTGYIVVLSPEGRLLSEFGRMGNSDGAFFYPEQLAAGPDGLWAIADRENNRVVVFRLHTPYPPVKDLMARKYPGGLAFPPEVFPTPRAQPIASPAPTP